MVESEAWPGLSVLTKPRVPPKGKRSLWCEIRGFVSTLSPGHTFADSLAKIERQTLESVGPSSPALESI